MGVDRFAVGSDVLFSLFSVPVALEDRGVQEVDGRRGYFRRVLYGGHPAVAVGYLAVNFCWAAFQDDQDVIDVPQPDEGLGARPASKQVCFHFAHEEVG